MVRAKRPSGDLERSVMRVLQAAGRPLTPREIQPLVGSDLAYTTVLTIVTRLYDKGLVERERAGRAFAYRPVADEPGLAVRRLHQIIDGEPDREIVLSRFLGSLSKRDEHLIRQMLSDLDTRPADRPAPPAD
ncbi:BlaI/MecI/CopY family transcriptional regulator [Frankia sp. Ag45/Mut15]|uniref:BlaI/MecI/CopY family transcriptional regulator n=1 Tax=Frankia umida TaxID=573489 RepID=A0ABT0K3D6_9ACTN|nr:BlaI/MecI/CopY family transcriptional regulator [Frankia umida]MCK9878242.1 BlaI/MecI/CopY family transcriptional regulator [Frankia umida]